MRATRASGIAGLAGIMSAVWDLSREACSCTLVRSCSPLLASSMPSALWHALLHKRLLLLCAMWACCWASCCPAVKGGEGQTPHAHPLAPAECAMVEVCCPAAKGGVGQAPVLNLRPLLNMHKHELEALLREQGVRWVRDPTNIDEDYLRNHLRALMQHLPAPALPADVVGQVGSAWGPPPAHLYSAAPSAAAAAPNGAQGGAARQAVHWPQQQQQQQHRQQQHAYQAGPGQGGRRAERQPRSRVIQAVRGHSTGEAAAAAGLAGTAALQQPRSLHADLLRVCGACSELDDVLRQQAGALLLGGRPVVHVGLPDPEVSPQLHSLTSRQACLGLGLGLGDAWLGARLARHSAASLSMFVAGWGHP